MVHHTVQLTKECVIWDQKFSFVYFLKVIIEQCWHMVYNVIFKVSCSS